ncbi:Acetate kinase [Thalassovita gelatinovora]|uniref:Acetate kinase n=1 Tax=Thalassovita gelatinovora TaxID=53501 RepID=A0A0P1F3Y5_THAGE|nr:acetate/propionate family kinase [Thalassovita gelatinovora]QIZ79243.1 acetate/propionate family kinase [Thalassovita gelatinovora]CUH62423.1 Acetate kinase [Thalassovita gelatinovora]SER17889.1 acetate kinase [Thalassovita gelatinovora]
MAHALTLNAGSSSLKFGLFDLSAVEPSLIASGKADRIGGAATLTLKNPDGVRLIDAAPIPTDGVVDHQGALATALNALNDHLPQADIVTVGHRIVHGGLHYSGPALIDAKSVEKLAELEPFAPLHQPHNLAAVRAAMQEFPQAAQVGCFDTAFHRDHPFVNDVFALPRAYYDKGVRRYGFHGLSYDYIAGELARTAPQLHAGRVVVAHLGNGASMCGMKAGQSMASSMGFSTLDGLPMGTRCGQIDPGVLLYLMQQEGLSADGISTLLYTQSGLLGLSGLSNDMRTLQSSDSEQAQQAIDYFTFRARRELGGLAAALEGLDGVVFCGGIGENSSLIRDRICAGLGWIGIEIDAAANATNAPVISTETAQVKVMVIPTNEEIVIARACAKLTG